MAVEDARASFERRTSEVVELGQKDCPDCKATEIAREYRRAYTAERTKLTPIDLWEQVKPHLALVGILLLVGALLGAALRKVLTEWVSVGFEAISDWTYARLGGSHHRSLDSAQVRKRVQQLLPLPNLQPEGAQPLLDEIVERSGLLLCIDNGQRYQFAHLTIQEFFAAGALKDDEAEMLAQLRANAGTWRETAKLWCGLTSNATSFLAAVTKLELLVAVECLAEAVEVDETVANGILEAAEQKQNSVDETVAYAAPLGNLAASPRPRGRRIFEFLVAAIGWGPDCLQRDMAAFAPALSNLPAAAEALARTYVATKNGRLLDALVRMGDVAVPWCVRVAKEGRLQLLDTLREIGTPDAARALADLLWTDEQRALGVRAATNLAALLPQSAIEEEIDSYPLTAEQRWVSTLDWIWSPFSTRPGSPLPVLAGRIGHVIGTAEYDELPRPLPAIDPRIGVPLCAIHWRDELQVPKYWDAEGDVLVADAEPDRDPDRVNYIRDVLSRGVPASRSRDVLYCMSRRLTFELRRRMNAYRRPNVEDWRRLFDKIQ